MSDRPATLVFAYSLLGHALLSILLERDANVVGVITHRDNPDENIFFPSVAGLCAERGLECAFDDDVDVAEAAALFGSPVSLVFSFAFRSLLPHEVIDVELGAYNLHPSPLPRYRGRAPVNWMVLNGEREGAATLHRMVEQADAGDIVFQRMFPIPDWWTAYEVLQRATREAEIGLQETLPLIESGSPPSKAQNPAEASYFGRRTPDDGRIDWTASARRVFDLVRAVTDPYPGAFATIGGERLGVWWACPLGFQASGVPGTVVAADARTGILVACGAGVLAIEELEYRGERMSATEAVKRGLIQKGELIA